MDKDVKSEKDTEIDLILKTDFSARILEPFCIKVGSDVICIPGIYANYIENVKSFQIRDEDVFVMGYPKTGTTWSQEMVWLVVNNLDYERAGTNILTRFPLLEYPSGLAENMEDINWVTDATKCMQEMESPRLIKTHLPWFLLPEQIQNGTKQPKIIYVLRNPKDCCVSYYHYMKFLRVYTGPFENFCKLTVAGREPYGSFWKSVLSFWQQRHRSNILFVEYTEMKKSLPAVIKKVATFLGKSLTEDQVVTLANHLSFESMKKNPAINHQTLREKKENDNDEDDNSSFFRRGKVGDHKNLMTPEIVEKFDAWTKQSVAGMDFSFKSLLE